LLTGIFAEARWGGTDGLLFGHPAQLGLQALGVATTIVYSAVASFVLLKLVGVVTPLRVEDRGQGVGLDISQHGEEAYAHGEGALLVLERRRDVERRVAFTAGDDR
jgi:Amt family ammonium transporter